MKLSDFIPKDIYRKLVTANISIGDIYTVPMNEENGITPKNGALFRPKFFIVLGVDDEGTIYGGVIINSGINKNIHITKQDYHYPIRKQDYPFLKYDSYISCAEIKPLSLEKLLRGTYAGNLRNDDLSLVREAVIESPFTNKAELRRFHLID